ncbi:hypothetical protein WJX72_011697 [[Myrmecia] bisecta]|uniref:Uncharacterized protein n=1 Tax=[Myrmecia] bisecta TaxID=41462 RepID=A0AAW1PXC7_9CHLO
MPKVIEKAIAAAIYHENLCNGMFGPPQSGYQTSSYYLSALPSQSTDINDKQAPSQDDKLHKTEATFSPTISDNIKELSRMVELFSLTMLDKTNRHKTGRTHRHI